MANYIDKNFHSLMKIIDGSSYENICELMKQYLKNLEENTLYPYMLASYNAPENDGFWGKIDPENDIYELIENRAKALKEHTDDFKWLYGELCDYRSKKVLCNVLSNWITFNWDYLNEIRENSFKDYFDLDLFPEISYDEVFVDIGGYIGDTISDFVDTYGEIYSSVISYEVDSDNFAKLQNCSEKYIGVDARNKAVGDKCGKMRFTSEGSTTKASESGSNEVDVVTLDEDVNYRISWIKMDIEGAEQSAIIGASEHIKKDNPKLSICTYHNNEDIWKIPRMIKEINSNYRFYMRYNGGINSIYPCEYVLHCLPENN